MYQYVTCKLFSISKKRSDQPIYDVYNSYHNLNSSKNIIAYCADDEPIILPIAFIIEIRINFVEDNLLSRGV